MGCQLIALRSEATRALWAAIEIAFRESSLTDSYRMLGDPWYVAAQWLSAYWPTIFPDDPPTGSPGSLDDFLSYWVAPDITFAHLALVLSQNGVTTARLRRSIPNGDLLRAAESDAKRMNQWRPVPINIPPGSAALADDIDGLEPGEAH
jgi:hypothetical protein